MTRLAASESAFAVSRVHSAIPVKAASFFRIRVSALAFFASRHRLGKKAPSTIRTFAPYLSSGWRHLRYLGLPCQS